MLSYSVFGIWELHLNGKLADDWDDISREMLRMPSPVKTMDRKYIRYAHLICYYFPLRYWSWVDSSQQRNPDTENRLFLTIEKLDDWLWSCVLQDTKSSLLDLVLPETARVMAEHRFDPVWEGRYLERVRSLSQDWSSNEVHIVDYMAIAYTSWHLSWLSAFSLDHMVADSARYRRLRSDSRFDHASATVVGSWHEQIRRPRDNFGQPRIGKETGISPSPVRVPGEYAVLRSD